MEEDEDLIEEVEDSPGSILEQTQHAEAIEEDEQVLLYSDFPEVRMISFPKDTDEQATIVAVIQEETEDSFLVRMPVRMAGNPSSGQITVVSFTPLPYLRVMKSSIKLVMPIWEPLYPAYVQYLAKEGIRHFPQILNDIGQHDFQELPGESPVEEEDDKEAEDQDLKVVGLSEEEAEQKVREAFLNGQLILNDSDTKH